MALIHGGDVAGFVSEYGYEPLDFSANCSPLGVPDNVRQAICAAAGQADAYPDPLCRQLRAELARHEAVLPEQVWCGNGSADLIFRLVQAVKPNRALVTAPTFAEYERALSAAGCQAVHHRLAEKSGFHLDETILTRLTPDLDLLFLCNPNNPTGLLINPDLMRRILDICAAADIRIVVDECFNGLVAQPEHHSVIGLLARYPHLVVLKAFTKLYGLAGLRLGYCLSHDQDLLRAIRDTGQPWAVSSLAQAAGLAALANRDYVAAVRTLIRQEKTWLIDKLDPLPLTLLGSEANWLFFKTGCADLADRLRHRGILIRDCSNYPGLEPGYYRIAIRTHAENIQLAEALTGSLENAGR